MKKLLKNTKLSKNLQIAIPKKAGFKPGEQVKIIFDPKTENVIIEKIPNPIHELSGILKDIDYSSDKFLKEKKDLEAKRYKDKFGL